MTADPTDPDPQVTPGLTPGGEVRAGDTPPAADQMSGSAPDHGRGDQPNLGPVSGNRTPMTLTLAVLAVVVVAVAVLVGLVVTGVAGR